MSGNRKFAIVLLTVWILLCLVGTTWAISLNYGAFYDDGIRKGLSSIEAYFYAIRLSAIAAGWLKIPLIFGNVPVALLFRKYWKAN
jgi:hypothetical protein